MTIGVGIYVKNSAEAVELYKKAFGLELGYHVKNPDGSYFHSELYKGDKELLSVVEATDDLSGKERVQLGIEFESEAELRKAFALLIEGGTIETPIGPLPWSNCAAALTDKFGIRWYFSAGSHYPEEDYEPGNP